MVPSTNASPTEATVIARSYRVATIVREKTSSPRRSVPNRYGGPGFHEHVTADAQRIERRPEVRDDRHHQVAGEQSDTDAEAQCAGWRGSPARLCDGAGGRRVATGPGGFRHARRRAGGWGHARVLGSMARYRRSTIR